MSVSLQKIQCDHPGALFFWLGFVSQSGDIWYQWLLDETEEIKEARVCVSEGTGAFNVSVDTTCRVCCAWLMPACVYV